MPERVGSSEGLGLTGLGRTFSVTVRSVEAEASLALAKGHDSTALDVVPEDVLAVPLELDVAVGSSRRKHQVTTIPSPFGTRAFVLALVLFVVDHERDDVAARRSAQLEGEGCDRCLARAQYMHVLAEVRKRRFAGQLTALAKREDRR